MLWFGIAEVIRPSAIIWYNELMSRDSLDRLCGPFGVIACGPFGVVGVIACGPFAINNATRPLHIIFSTSIVSSQYG